jgi:hypothetical protein
VSHRDARIRTLILAALLVVAGCTAAEPLEGIDLPPASVPDEIDPDQWAVAYSHRFDSGFWTEGPHVYRLSLDCPDAIEEKVLTGINFFGAGPDVPTNEGTVYLRPAGLSTTPLGATNVQSVSTEQETTALLTVIGLTRERAEAAAACSGEVEFDDGQSEPLEPGEPFRP